MINKKIRNATPTEYDGIKFRSKLEARVYKYLISKEIVPLYEKYKITLWQKAKDSFTVPYYDKVGKTFKKVTTKPLPVTYTPDFVFPYKEWNVFLEVKGFKNDVVPYKIRLFREWLEGHKFELGNPCFAVVKSIKEIEQLLKELE